MEKQTHFHNCNLYHPKSIVTQRDAKSHATGLLTVFRRKLSEKAGANYARDIAEKQSYKSIRKK